MGGNYRQDQLPSDIFNSQSGDIKNWNGRAVKITDAGNGTRNIEDLGDYNAYNAQQQAKSDQQAAQAKFEAQQGSAVSTLQTGKANLADQYKALLGSVTGQFQPLINQETQTEGNLLAQRGLTPDSALYQQQVQGALQPIYGQQAQEYQTIGAGSISDTNAYNQAISAAQQSGAQFGASLPLQYGNLALQQQLLPSQIQGNLASANLANAQAKAAPYIPTSYGGVIFNAGNQQTFNPMLAALQQMGYRLTP